MKKILASIAIVSFIASSTWAVECKRSIKTISNNEITVEIVIDKDQHKSFARLAESFPVGAEVKHAKSDGGTFIIKDNGIKFIWLNLPQQNSFTVSYTVSTGLLKEGTYAFSGKFSYVEGEQTKEYEIPANSFTINANQVASIAPITTPLFTTDNVANNISEVEKPVSTKTLTKTSKITYTLQLISTKDKLATDYFSKKYQIEEPITVETTNGINNYLLGSYNSIEEASKVRKDINSKGCKDSFIVPLLNNQRITLEEAKKLDGQQ